MNEELAPYETLEVRAPGTLLFEEGSPVDRIFVVRSGEVEIRFSARRTGETRAMFVAGPGDILGLGSVVGNRCHDCSATTRTTCITGAIDRETFFKLLEEKPGLWLTVLRTISANINACWECMRTLSTR